MHRCGTGLLFRSFVTISTITLVVCLTGCLGKSTSNAGNGGVQTVSLSPSGSLSLDVGTTQVFSATGKDATGRTVPAVSIQYIVAVPQNPNNPIASAPVSVASNGNACAGTWDISNAICSPGLPGVATVRAVINGVSSTPTTVYVHQHIDSIRIVNTQDQPPQYDCFSQGQTWQFAAKAFSNNIDISNTVGPMSWSSSNTGVVTATPSLSGSPGNQINLVQTTAKAPGITQLFASVAGTSSSPFLYTTCLVQSITLQIGGQGQLGNSITVNHGGSVSVTATVFDTLHSAGSPPMPNPPLTWSTTNPEVAAFTTTANTTSTNNATVRANLGGTTLFASCTPPSCNIGLPGLAPTGTIEPSLPVYSSNCLPTSTPPCQLPNGTSAFGVISVDVISASPPPTYTAWVATTDCNNQPGCTSALFTVTPGTTPIGIGILTVPRTPNSMMFNHVTSPRLYIGSDQGLMFVDVGSTNLSVGSASNATTPCNVALCGKVLTISNDGKLAVVADNISTPNQVYIFNGGSATTPPVDLIIPGETATAAAFSPDQLKLFILTQSGNMYVYSTVDALSSVPVATSLTGSLTDVEFAADGSFAYVAGAPPGSVSAYSTCSQSGNASVNVGSVVASTTPVELFPSPVIQADSQGLTQTILALEPPNVEFLTAQFAQVPLSPTPPLPGQSQFTCNPPDLMSFSRGASFNLGQPAFTPLYTRLVADGTELIVVAENIPAVLLFNVNNGTTTSIHLVGDSFPLSASASTDGSQVYVAACDQYPNNDPTQPCAAGSVHIVNTISQGDLQQVPYVNIDQNNNPNMCNSQGVNAPLCLPNLVALQPR